MASSLEYQVFRCNFTKLVNGVKQDVAKVARKAFEATLISSQNLQEAENELMNQEHRTSQLLQQILGKVEHNADHFDTFVAILKSEPVLKEFSDELTTELANLQVTTHRTSQDLNDSTTDSCTASCTHKDEDEVAESAKDLDTHRVERCDSPTKNDSSGNSDADLLLQQLSIESLSPAHSPSTSVATAISTEEDVYFRCRCGSNCTLDIFLKGECCGSLKNSFPHLNIEHLSDSDQKELALKLLSEANRISKKFNNLVCDTFMVLGQQNAPVKTLVAVVLTVGQSSLPSAITADHNEELCSATSVFDVQLFLVKHKYISFFNYRILEKIVECFTTKKLKERLQDYLTEFQKFCKRSVFEVPALVVANSAPACDPKIRLVIKVNEKIWFGALDIKKSSQSNFSLEDLMTLQVELATVIGMDSANLLLCDVKKGCVEVSFILFSTVTVVRSLFPLNESQMMRLTNKGITITAQPGCYVAVGKHKNPQTKKGHMLSGVQAEQVTTVHESKKSTLKEALNNLDKCVTQTELEQAKLILRAYGLPHDLLEPVNTISELFKLINVQTENMNGPDATSLLQHTLQLVGVDAKAFEQLGTEKEDLKAAEAELKFGELVHQLCTELSNLDYELLTHKAMGHGLTAHSTFRSRENFFQVCLSRKLLSKDGIESCDMVRWLQRLGRTELIARVEAYVLHKRLESGATPMHTKYEAMPTSKPSSSPLVKDSISCENYRSFLNRVYLSGAISKPEYLKPERTCNGRFIGKVKFTDKKTREKKVFIDTVPQRTHKSARESVAQYAAEHMHISTTDHLGSKKSRKHHHSTTRHESSALETYDSIASTSNMDDSSLRPEYQQREYCQGGKGTRELLTKRSSKKPSDSQTSSYKHYYYSRCHLAGPKSSTPISTIRPESESHTIHHKSTRSGQANKDDDDSLQPVSRLREYCDKAEIEVVYSFVNSVQREVECFKCIIQLRKGGTLIGEVAGPVKQNKRDSRNSAAECALGLFGGPVT